MWNHKTHPYRVRKISSGGFAGWSDSIATYATLEEASQAMKARMVRREFEFQLCLAKEDKNGKWAGWDRLATRKRNENVVWTKKGIKLVNT